MPLEIQVRAVRAFNRFYTRQIGLLREGYLTSRFSLTEVRVLYELAHREIAIASEIASDLDLDAGYLSRILERFRKLGLVRRIRSERDGRQQHLELTKKGSSTFQPLDEAANTEIAALLRRIPNAERNRVVTAMTTIFQALSAPAPPAAKIILRSHRPGDIGWVIHRHGVLYAQEQGWDERFEALVAGIAAQFIHNLDPQRERCWIAERDGEIVGSVFLMRESDKVARLRLLLVEPSARGCGLGACLVDECVRFARRSGYHRITLWTQGNLVAARKLYTKAGFRLVHEEEHTKFGIPLIGQTWQLELSSTSA